MRLVLRSGVLALLLVGCPSPSEDSGPDSAPPDDTSETGTPEDPGWVVLAWPTRGMSPMDPSYAELCLWPPGVSLEAQVLQRDLLPGPVQAGSLRWAPQVSSEVSGSSDFWDHAASLLGDEAPAQGTGLTGLALEGQSDLEDGAFAASMLPVVPAQGSGSTGPFPLFELEVFDGEGTAMTTGLVVAPSSTDRGCRLCHDSDAAILQAHVEAHDVELDRSAPVRCGVCHAQPSFDWEGDGEATALAPAMHTAHADRMVELDGQLESSCLACHPGPDTPFYRGTHSYRDTSCVDCHGDMTALGSPERTPWVDLPRCEDCHETFGSEYQQPGVSFNDSVGHGELRCPVCHHAPHGLYGSTIDADNAQNVELQGYAGVVSTCRVCHDPNPGGLFPHVR